MTRARGAQGGRRRGAGRKEGDKKERERRHRQCRLRHCRRHCFTRNFLRHPLLRSALNDDDDGKYAQIERGKEGEETAHTATMLTTPPQRSSRPNARRLPRLLLAAAAWKKCKHGASELTRSVLCLASGQSRRLDDRERRRRWRREKGGRIAESEGTAHFPPAGLAISGTKALHSPAHLPSRPSPYLSSPRSIH